jgi:hypothetical protein
MKFEKPKTVGLAKLAGLNSGLFCHPETRTQKLHQQQQIIQEIR